MLSCAPVLPCWILIMPMLVLDLCNDCNEFVDPTISIRYRLKIAMNLCNDCNESL
jgi:hypothetical protein